MFSGVSHLVLLKNNLFWFQPPFQLLVGFHGDLEVLCGGREVKVNSNPRIVTRT